MAMPCFGIIQGARGMLRYRHYFGTPSYPRNPAHGVVVVNPEPLKEGANVGPYVSGCQCEGGSRWRRGGTLQKEEQAVLDKALREEPIRMLVIGDSLALGLGTDRSCMPMMPETLAKAISKQMGGRAVLWTGYGAEGAASSWTLKELSRKARKEAKAAEAAKNNGGEAAEPAGVALSDTSSNYSSDENTANNDSTNNDSTTPTSRPTNGTKANRAPSKKNKDPFGEWKDRLQNFRETFENDIAGPYDIVFIFAGGNDAKSAFIPFYVKTAKGEESTDYHKNDGRDSSLYSDFERIIEHLGPKMNTDFSSSAPNEKPLPLVVFPLMPSLVVPAFQKHFPVSWLVAPLTGIIENNKRRLQRKYPSHVVCVDAPTSKKAAQFEKQEGYFWQKRKEEDVLLCLRNVTEEQCKATTAGMTHHITTKSKAIKHRELRHESKEVTQANAPMPKLSELEGHQDGHNIFSIDDIHPNDEGYDFWGRLIADGVFQQVPALSTTS